MSGNFIPSTSTEPLSVISVVKASVILYRSHFKEYFFIALKAYLWLLVPIYGWVKFFALSSLICRLSFGELVNQPESVTSGQRFVNSRLWQYLVTMILMLFISVVTVAGFVFFVFTVEAISIRLLEAIQSGNSKNVAILENPINFMILVLVNLLSYLIAIIVTARFLTRFYLLDVALAVEDNINSRSSIRRTWQLTQGHVGTIMLILLTSFLLNVSLQFKIFWQIVLKIIVLNLPTYNVILDFLHFIIIIVSSCIVTALMIPLWQTIKAVVYYDLRTRREGSSLQLRNYNL